jgi:hypothetical protein
MTSERSQMSDGWRLPGLLPGRTELMMSTHAFPIHIRRGSESESRICLLAAPIPGLNFSRYQEKFHTTFSSLEWKGPNGWNKIGITVTRYLPCGKVRYDKKQKGNMAMNFSFIYTVGTEYFPALLLRSFGACSDISHIKRKR